MHDIKQSDGESNRKITTNGKGCVDRGPHVVKPKVLGSRRKGELLLPLLRSRSSSANSLPPRGVHSTCFELNRMRTDLHWLHQNAEQRCDMSSQTRRCHGCHAAMASGIAIDSECRTRGGIVLE